MISEKPSAVFRSSHRSIQAGIFVCGLAVALGALGAHALEKPLNRWYHPETAVRKMANWETGVRYQLVHGIALILTGLLARTSSAEASRCVPIASVAFAAGVVLFSGGLYAWVLLDQRAFVMIVPAGGGLFLAGWAAFLVLAIQDERP